MQEIDQPISWDELKVAVKILTNDKVPWLNKVPPNGFKVLNNDNFTPLLNSFKKYFLEETGFGEWQEIQIMSVQKKV